MIKYKFSRRERALAVFLLVVVLGLGWYAFVFLRTSDDMRSLNASIANIDSEYAESTAKLAKMNKMSKEIEGFEAAGEKPRDIPEYDNVSELMEELNFILADAQDYSITFPSQKKSSDRERSGGLASIGGYYMRAVDIACTCDSYESAERIAKALEACRYPCSIDAMSIGMTRAGKKMRLLDDGSGTSVASMSLQMTFYEHGGPIDSGEDSSAK